MVRLQLNCCVQPHPRISILEHTPQLVSSHSRNPKITRYGHGPALQSKMQPWLSRVLFPLCYASQEVEHLVSHAVLGFASCHFHVCASTGALCLLLGLQQLLRHPSTPTQVTRRSPHFPWKRCSWSNRHHHQTQLPKTFLWTQSFHVPTE